MRRALPLSVFLCTIPPASAALAKAPDAPNRRAPAEPSYAYVVPDGALGEGCEAACLKALAARLRKRPGVRRASVAGGEVELEIQPGAFKSELVQKGLDGMKIEMRAPYKAIELRFAGPAPFPPPTRIEDKILVVEMGEELKRAVEEAVSFTLSERMKCVGRLEGGEASDALLVRYEAEKRPLGSMVPFMAEADLDGDRRADLYLRLEGLPELVVFNKAKGLKVVLVSAVPAVLEEIPRCDQTPGHFARPVPRAKVRCNAATPVHRGDAIERVGNDGSAELLLWGGAAFSSCEPFVEGRLPPPPKGAQKAQ